MIARILLVAIAAGVIAGAFATVAQAVRVIPLILEAETYENAAAAPAATADSTKKETTTHSHDNAAAKGHSHGDAEAEEWGPEDGFQRIAFTLLSNILLGVGFSLVLTAGIVMAGVDLTLKTGILWGLAGFAVFTVSPAISLPPEMPGMVASDVTGRQIWWVATVICAAIGAALLVFGKNTAFKVAGVGLIALPHIIGAPHLDLHAETSNVPAELAVQFVMATLLSTGLFWLVLGASVGGLMQRFAKPA